MPHTQPQSRLTACITLCIILGLILSIGWYALHLITTTSHSDSRPKPTPTPQPGTFNIDDKLDMLNE